MTGVRPRNRRDLRYFYMNDKLFKLQKVVRETNLCICWDYAEEEWTRYNWTDVKKMASKSYTTTQVSKMLNRSPQILVRHINLGDLVAPPKSYPLQGNRNKLIVAYRWSDKHIMAAHDFFSHRYPGPQTLHGVGVPKKMPTKVEIRGMLREENVHYVRTESGEFKQIWQEGEW